MVEKNYTPVADPLFGEGLPFLEKNQSNPKNLSDHAYQIQQITPTAQVLSWNIMTRGNGSNNGYQLNEPVDQDSGKDLYIIRLQTIAKKLAQTLLENPDVAAITLQEVPSNPEERRAFIDAFNTELEAGRKKIGFTEGWEIRPESHFFATSPGNESFGMMTIVNSDRVQKAEVAKNSGLTSQQGRILTTDLVISGENDKPEHVRLVNVHLKYKKDPSAKQFTTEEVQSEIDKILDSIEEGGQVVLAGDFNHEMANLGPKENPKNRYKSSGNTTSYSYDPRAKEYRAHQVDGFIFKYDPNAKDLDLTKKPKAKASPQPTVQTSEPTSKNINFSGLLAHFSQSSMQSKGYRVKAIDSSVYVIELPPKKDGKQESIIIKKLTDEKIEFRSTDSSDNALQDLATAVDKCVPRGKTLNISVEGGTPKDRVDLADKLWLNAVKNGYNVGNYKPTAEFLEQHKEDLQEISNDLHPLIQEKYLPKAPHPNT